MCSLIKCWKPFYCTLNESYWLRNLVQIEPALIITTDYYLKRLTDMINWRIVGFKHFRESDILIKTNKNGNVIHRLSGQSLDIAAFLPFFQYFQLISFIIRLQSAVPSKHNKFHEIIKNQ